MPKTGGSVLTAEQEKELLKPIDQKIGSIQAQIDELRANGTNKVISTLSAIESTKRDKSISAEERNTLIEGYKAELELAKKVESENSAQVSKLIAEAETYLKEHYKNEYLEPVKASCALEKEQAKQNYAAALERLKKEHEEAVSKTSDAQEIKDEKYVYKNRQFDAKVNYQKDLQRIKDRAHNAFSHEYHLIDLLRMSQVHSTGVSGSEVGELQVHLQHPFILASERSVHCYSPGIYCPLYHYPSSQGHSASDILQRHQHSSAGIASNVPGSWCSWIDSAYWY